jgi:two-component sensor histidine kinase
VRAFDQQIRRWRQGDMAAGKLHFQRVPESARAPNANFALILHELATNAMKYGAWSKESGWVHVEGMATLELLRFRWREHDGPTLAPPVREGLGRKLIKSSLQGARVEHLFKPDGLQCEIDLPLAHTETS